MLLRIDAYASAAPPEQPPQTFYACLATRQSNDKAANDKNNGRIFTAGRKTGDALFSDKSVSREHLFLRLVSANKTHEAVDNESTSMTIPAPARPQNAAEIKACGESPVHQCVVLENIGKVGSFLVRVKVKKRASSTGAGATAAANEDSATEDDETDDEEGDGQDPSQLAASQQTHSVDLSPATRKLVADPSSVFLQQVTANESIVLPLSEDTPTIVQCGKLGSTLVIQPVIHNIIRSGADERRLASFWDTRLHCIGVQHSDTLDDSTTHLLSRVRDTTTKQLISWCRGVPIVTSDYLQALLDRTSPNDPLPDAVKFGPPIVRKETFWLSPANPSLLSGCKFLSSKADELEHLVRVAGATVIPLHTVLVAQAMTKVDTLLQADEADNDCQHYTCFAIQDKKSRRKLPRLVEERGVPQVTAKLLAQCVTEQVPLRDIKGVPIGKPGGEDDEDESAHAPSPKEDTKARSKAAKKATERETETKPSARASKKKESADADDFPTPDDNDEPMESHSQSQVLEVEHADGTIDTPSGGQAKARETEPLSKRKTRVSDVEHAHDQEDSTKKASATKPTPKAASRPSKRKKSSPQEVDTSDPAETSPPPKRIKKAATRDVSSARKTLQQSTSSGGWLAAAPKGKERRAFLRTTDEIKNVTGNTELTSPAVTEICKGMVFAPQKQPTAVSSSSSTGPNFKRFRKNPVIQQPRAPIKMRSVLPKETDQHREYEEQQRLMEEQQRKADALFRDGGRKGSGRGRLRV